MLESIGGLAWQVFHRANLIFSFAFEREPRIKGRIAGSQARVLR